MTCVCTWENGRVTSMCGAHAERARYEYAPPSDGAAPPSKRQRDALMQASLDLMNLSAFLRLEGKSDLADIGLRMSEAALVATKIP